MASRVCIGAIVGAHGIRGAVRIKSFTAVPADVGSYGPVEDEAGQRHFRLAVTGEVKGHVIAQLAGVADRNGAEALKGTGLYVPRDRLPEVEEDEFLYSDLVGLAVCDDTGQPVGTVRGVANYGAGDLLDILRPGQGSLLVPFTRRAVPVVDVAQRRVVISPPAYDEDEADDDDDDGRRRSEQDEDGADAD